MKKISWEDAPEWAIQVCASDISPLCSFWSDGGTMYSYKDDVVKEVFFHGQGYARNYDEFIVVEKKPTIYQPKVNDRCVIKYKISGVEHESEALIKGFFSDEVWFSHIGSSRLSYTCNVGDVKFKPLDLRTPKEKAVDNACNGLRQGNNKLVKGMLEELYELGLLKEVL
jgi:hypothetical protein